MASQSAAEASPRAEVSRPGDGNASVTHGAASPSVQAPPRLDFRHGEPTVPVRLMEGQVEVRFRPRSRMRLTAAADVPKTLEAPPNGLWRVRLVEGKPAQLSISIQVAELPFADKDGVAQEQARWEERHVAVKLHTIGSVYGIAGKVIDNRKYVVLLDEPFATEDAARGRQAELLQRFAVRTTLFEQVREPGAGTLEVLDESGNSVALAADRIRAETERAEGFQVERVEYGVGYDFHNFESRSYRGALELTVDAHGKLAVVNLVSLEDLLKGLVPSEIFARAPAEALKAQAVTARGEVLAKVGQKHLADPYLLCSEQHCAVYKGRSQETAATNAAVEATRGQAIFDAQGKLVDSVYSAVCGGHTESNENVWGGPPNPSLRGKPDLLGEQAEKAETDALPSPRDLPKFLSTELPAACRLSSFAQPTKFRWEKRFSAAQMNELTRALKLGNIRAIQVVERGVSGRAKLLTLAGEEGATQIRGELNIRRLFGMLNSSMFVVTQEKDAKGQPVRWIFQGGGWGHGVGLCQTGAIGRAEAGQDYQAILQHYFSGTQVSRIY